MRTPAEIDDCGSGGGPSPTDPQQVFEYLCTGAEGATITINGAKGFVARTTINYVVQFTLRKPLANALKLAAIQGTPGLTSFVIELSAPVEADDVLCFTINDLT